MSAPFIDLRSDTVTKPTPGMRRAMAEAEVGDDVFGEDPTVNRLVERVARLLGKEAALFVPSGTMANQIAVRAHTQPGDEMICEENSHVFLHEAGAPAALSGVQVRCVRGERGLLCVDAVREAVRPDNPHFPASRLLVVENTHNRGGGTIYPVELLESLFAAASDAGLRVHMDGARLWNASAASGRAPLEYARFAHSVSVCLSKGLGAPAGSLLAGDASFIRRAHRLRKMFGGGMRQTGVLAAAGLYALENHVERLASDHENARFLAYELARIPGVLIDPVRVETNIVFFTVEGRQAPQVAHCLRERGVAVLADGPARLRAVTHLDVGRDDLERAVEIIRNGVKP